MIVTVLLVAVFIGIVDRILTVGRAAVPLVQHMRRLRGTPGDRDRTDMTKKWYVVHTYSGHENKVKTNLEKAIHSAGLEEQFGQILVATEEFVEMKDGKRKTSKRKTFPSYVMVEMELERRDAAPGAERAGRDALHRLRARARSRSRRTRCGASWARWRRPSRKPTPTVPFRIGDHVRVVDGPFSAFTGVVDEVNNERGKVKVMVSIFGRATPVELDFLQVQPV